MVYRAGNSTRSGRIIRGNNPRDAPCIGHGGFPDALTAGEIRHASTLITLIERLGAMY